MNDRKHTIHRQLFELTAATGKPAWEWDRTSADFHRDLLLPVLDACFGDADRGGEHLVIDRLDIDLGVFAGKESFIKEAGDRLRERLALGLREKRQEASARKVPLSDQVASATNSTTAGDPKTNKGNARPEILDEKEASLTAFLYFLQTGRLPWWFDPGETNVFGDTFQDTLTASGIRKILLLLEDVRPGDAPRHATPATVRCIQALSDAVLARLASEKGGRADDWLRGWDSLKSPAQRFPAFFPAFRQRFWTWLLSATPNAAEAPWQHLFPEKEAPAHLLAVIHGDVQLSTFVGLQDFLEARLAAASPGWSPEPAARREEISQVAGGKPAPQQPHPSPHTKNTFTEIAGEDGWYVESAGLVLLHPFLSELLAATGCRLGKEWSAHGQQTAVRLLGYLSDGDADLPEYRLGFQKILAGLAPEAPLEAIAPLTEAQLASCDELLNAVLHHWAALKNTSASGLREGFLQRPGMLRTHNGGLQLEMEKRAQDVLIGRLPWSCSLVRLSWMEQLVTVNWI